VLVVCGGEGCQVVDVDFAVVVHVCLGVVVGVGGCGVVGLEEDVVVFVVYFVVAVEVSGWYE